MGISSSKKKTKKAAAAENSEASSQITTIEEVEEQSIPEVESFEEDKILNLVENIEEISEHLPEMMVEVNMLPGSTMISKLPTDIQDLQSFGKLDQTTKTDEIMSLKEEIMKLKEERDSLRDSFSEEFKTKLAEIHGHLQKRLDSLQEEVETNVKAKFEATLKTYDVQVKILEKKNKILQDL